MGLGTQTSPYVCPCWLSLVGTGMWAIAVAAVTEVCAVAMRQG